MKIQLLLIKLKIIKITPKRIQNWTAVKNLDLIIYAAKNSGFRCRIEIAKCLSKFKYNEIESILFMLLYDKVFTVVENTISTFKKYKLTNEVIKEVDSVNSSWEKKNLEMKKNWSSLDSNHQGLYIDKSKMKRLTELKYWMAKFKGSMSIG